MKKSELRKIIIEVIKEEKVLQQTGTKDGNCFCVWLDTDDGTYSNQTLGGCNYAGVQDCDRCCTDNGMVWTGGGPKGPIDIGKAKTNQPTQGGVCCKNIVSQKRINVNEENKCPKGSVQINCPK